MWGIGTRSFGKGAGGSVEPEQVMLTGLGDDDDGAAAFWDGSPSVAQGKKCRCAGLGRSRLERLVAAGRWAWLFIRCMHHFLAAGTGLPTSNDNLFHSLHVHLSALHVRMKLIG